MGRLCLKFLVLSSLCLVACGKFSDIDESGFTEVRFSRGADADEAPGAKVVLPGGILIYAYSDNFATNLKLPDESTGGASIRLPNGAYSFYAFGYIAASPVLQSSVKCAVVGDNAPIALNGTSVSIALQLSQTECTNGAFTDGGSFSDGTEFRELEFVHCGPAADLSTLAGSSSCSGTGWFTSLGVKAKAPIFRFENGQSTKIGDGLESGCLSAFTSGGVATNQVRFPAGRSAGRNPLFAIEFETYSEVSCTSSPIAVHSFHRGLAFGPSPTSPLLGKAVPNTNVGTRIFLRQP